MAVKIVTDSTSDIPKDLVDKYGIIELPLTVHFGNEEFRDRVDITHNQFYEKLEASDNLPTTSQVTPPSFMEVYKRELDRGNSVISIHLSSELSGTYQSGVIAKQSIEDDRISVIDSRTATLALGMIVLKAAQLAEAGMEKDDIVREIEDYKNKVKIMIVVDTLEYLRKGGRLSGAQAVIGGLLNIKPVLTIEDGKVIVIDKVRGMKKAHKRVIELIGEKGSDISKQTIGIANAKCPDVAQELKDLVKEEFGDIKFIEAEVGSVIATHIGPGAFGAVFV